MRHASRSKVRRAAAYPFASKSFLRRSDIGSLIISSRDFELPASILHDPPDVTCVTNGIRMQVEGTAAAKVSIWHDHWTPFYAKDGGYTRCGMLTEMSTSHLNLGLERHNLHLGWVARLRRWSCQTDYGEYELTTQQEFFFN